MPGVGKAADEKVIFADNVGFQQDKQFHEACRKESNAVVYLQPENHTDVLQPMYSCIVALLSSKPVEGWDTHTCLFPVTSYVLF